MGREDEKNRVVDGEAKVGPVFVVASECGQPATSACCSRESLCLAPKLQLRISVSFQRSIFLSLSLSALWCADNLLIVPHLLRLAYFRIARHNVCRETVRE